MARGLHAQSGEIRNRAAGPVIAGNPLWINEREGARLDGNVQDCVIDVSWRIRQIDCKTNCLS